MGTNANSYNTIEGIASGEIVEKKSRFIATVMHVESEEEANARIEELKKKYWDARHNCYAFILGKGSETMRFSDDGEPSGTAGKPILEVLKGRELTNTLVVVTRYFGGVLLGTGGLVRAYTDSTIEGLSNADLRTMQLMQCVGIDIDYNTIGKLKYMLASNEINILNEAYTDAVRVNIALPVNEVQRYLDSITDVTNGKATFEMLEEQYISNVLCD